MSDYKVGDKFKGYRFRTEIRYKCKGKIYLTNHFNEENMLKYIGEIGIILEMDKERNLVGVQFASGAAYWYPIMNKEIQRKLR